MTKYILGLCLVAALSTGFEPAWAAGGSTGGSANGDCQKEVKPDPAIDYAKRKLNVEDLSLQLLQYLESSGAQVAMVSRAGSDLSKRKFKNPSAPKYSHMGLVVKNYKNQGAWKFVHLLNTCAGPTSDIYEQGLRDFFTDDPYMYDIVVGIPSPALQSKIVQVLEDTSVPPRGWKLGFHNKSYSNIANPFSLIHQNSNMWILSVIAAAQSGLKSREDIQNYYQAKGFTPSQVNVGGISSLGVALGFAGGNVSLDDHTAAEKSAHWYNFVSTDSVYDYVRKTDRLVSYQEVCYAGTKCNVPVTQLEAK